jgi:hypothetical protein
MSRDNSVGIATGYELDGRGWIPDRGRDFSLLHSVQSGSGAHLTSHAMGTGNSFLGGKAAGSSSWPFTILCCRGQEW